VDEEIGEMYLNEEAIPNEKIKEAIRRTTIERTFCPVFLGSAYKNKGIQLALNAVADYLPDPSQIENFALEKYYRKKI
jgi:elongation factor G